MMLSQKSFGLSRSPRMQAPSLGQLFKTALSSGAKTQSSRQRGMTKEGPEVAAMGNMGLVISFSSDLRRREGILGNLGFNAERFFDLF